ncbi:hypothetical protein VJJ49_10390, partial [Capnocytophaga gingivalis]|nr:hypothetical protein [Capnocytophaga gingivalis]
SLPSYFRSKNVLFILTFCTFHFADYITSDFLIIKHKEDVLGGFNLFILLIYLIINIFYKQEENKVEN